MSSAIRYHDLYPFGPDNYWDPMPTRVWRAVTLSGAEGRYGFNGKEKDNEINVDGGDYDFGARIYDSRLGRWLSLDPMMKKYADLAPYSYTGLNPIMYIEVDGAIFDLSNLTEEQKKEYDAKIEKLKKSDLFAYVYKKMEASNSVFVLKFDSNTDIGGSFEPDQNNNGHGGTIAIYTPNTVEEVSSYVFVKEFFHGFQNDNKEQFYEGLPSSTIETEGDLFAFYCVNQLKYELIPNYGDWSEEIVNSYNYKNPNSEQISSNDYNDLFQKAVDKRIDYYKNQEKYPEEYASYTSENTGAKPNALIKVVKETEAINNNLEGPRLENGDYYAQ